MTGPAGAPGQARARGVAAFVRARREGWERLEALSARVDGGRLSLAEVEELDRLYRRAAGDLAHARAAFPGTDAEGYLAQVTARAYAALYRGQARPLAAVLDLYRREAPAVAVGAGWALALSAGCLLAGVLGGAAAALLDPAGAGGLVPDGVRRSLAAGRLWTGDLLSAAPGLAGGAILRNNVAVAALCFALGLTGGLGTAALLLANGALLGAVTVAVAQAGLLPGFLAFLAAHGPAELSALALAGQGGFLLASGLVRPGEWPRGEALAARGRDGARLLAVAVPVLLLVALVEATVSPAEAFPAAARAALGLGLAGALWGYLWRAGRAPTAATAAAPGSARGVA
ncbi:MAG: stage II sporulation protein M [Anaeromyxobacteraceae bacterium]|nr:stage II sporulation protein M [Anaeromyxobacteraceae bacterium]